MDVSDAIRDAAREMPGGTIAVPDTTQVFLHRGVPSIPHTAIIGFYIVSELGEVVAFEPNLAYRMLIRP